MINSTFWVILFSEKPRGDVAVSEPEPYTSPGGGFFVGALWQILAWQWNISHVVIWCMLFWIKHDNVPLSCLIPRWHHFRTAFGTPLWWTSHLSNLEIVWYLWSLASDTYRTKDRNRAQWLWSLPRAQQVGWPPKLRRQPSIWTCPWHRSQCSCKDKRLKIPMSGRCSHWMFAAR